MSQMIPSQLVSGQVVQGQVVTAAQVVNTAGQVVMTSSGVVGGQLLRDLVVATGPQQQQHLQHTLQQAVVAPVQQHQIIQQASLQQPTVLQETQNIVNVNSGTATITQNHQGGISGVIQQQQAPKVTLPVPSPASSVPVELPAPVINRSRLSELVREVDPTEQLDEEVEDVLLSVADDFIEASVAAACMLAQHRGARTLDVRDLHLYLERTWHMWIPGFGTEELRPYKRAPTTEAHKQRMALIRKAVKKY